MVSERVLHANACLRAARRNRPSPSGSGRPMSRQELADACNQFLARHYADTRRTRRWAGITASYVGSLERGETRWPNEDYRAALRHALGATDSELGFYIDRPDRAQAADDNSRVPMLELSETGKQSPYGDPEEILHEGVMGTGSSTGSILAATDRVRQILEETLDKEETHSAKVQRLQEAVDHHARDVLTVPPLNMISRMALDILSALRLIQQPYAAMVRELQIVLAKLAVLTADEMNVVGNVHAARRWYTTAMTAADRSEVPELRADVHALAAMLPLYHGDPVAGVQLAQRARHLANGRNCLAGALAPMLEALAWASQGAGHREKAQAALCDALHAYDATSDEVRNDSVFGLSPRRRLFYESRILTKIANYPSAQTAHRQALELYPEDVVGDRTIIHLDRAAALIARGDADRGADLISTTLDTLPVEHQATIFTATASRIIVSAPKKVRTLPAMQACAELVRDVEQQTRAGYAGRK